MKTISVGGLRQNPADMLRDVVAGQSYLVTNHGHPVAEIVPHRSEQWVSAAEANEVLARVRVDPEWATDVEALRSESDVVDPWGTCETSS